jgi:hypothetical protein
VPEQLLRDLTDDLVTGYPTLPGDTQPAPRAHFWLFTGPTAPDDPELDLVPLYRLTRDRDEFIEFCGDGVTTLHRAWGYATNFTEIRLFYDVDTFADGIRYFPEGIEGYLYPTTATPPTGAERLYRYYDAAADDWLLLLESESPPPGYDDPLFGPLGSAPDGEWLGWVLPAVDFDLDGLVDAWEEILGTDPQDEDSDGDGCSDGAEILGFIDPAEHRLSDPLDGLCLFDLLFLDGFETGDTSAWN